MIRVFANAGAGVAGRWAENLPMAFPLSARGVAAQPGQRRARGGGPNALIRL